MKFQQGLRLLLHSRTRRGLCIALTAWCSMWPFAGQVQSAEPAIDCKRVEKDGGPTPDLTICASRANLQARENLERVAKKLRLAIPTADGKRLLDQSQSNWLTWKKAEAKLCTYAVGGYDAAGSGYEFQLNYCATDLTNQRAKVLQRYLDTVKSR